MIFWIFLAAYVTLIFSVTRIGYREGGRGDAFGSFLGSVFFGGIILGLVLFLTTMVVNENGGYNAKAGDLYLSYIVSLKQGDGVKGNFFLGSGTIDSVQYYFFYQKSGEHLGNPTYQLLRHRTNSSVICEIDGEIPRIEWNYYYYSPPWWLSTFDWPFKYKRESQYRFIVPKGTIIQAYKV